MGYSKKLYNVLGGYAYYTSIPPNPRKDQYFTNMSKTAMRFCAVCTIKYLYQYPLSCRDQQTKPQIPLAQSSLSQ